MKYFILFSLVTISSIFYSCNKTKTAFEHATMKPWFDTHCASCHASGKSNDGDWLYDANDYEGSIKSEIHELNNLVVVNKTMPPAGGISTAELQKFIDWHAAGAPAK